MTKHFQKGEYLDADALNDFAEQVDAAAAQIPEKGDKGDKGNKGNKGDKGDKGAAGRDGVDGTDGATGAAGVDGTDGKDGTDGATYIHPPHQISDISGLRDALDASLKFGILQKKQALSKVGKKITLAAHERKAFEDLSVKITPSAPDSLFEIQFRAMTEFKTLYDAGFSVQLTQDGVSEFINQGDDDSAVLATPTISYHGDFNSTPQVTSVTTVFIESHSLSEIEIDVYLVNTGAYPLDVYINRSAEVSGKHNFETSISELNVTETKPLPVVERLFQPFTSNTQVYEGGVITVSGLSNAANAAYHAVDAKSASKYFYGLPKPEGENPWLLALPSGLTKTLIKFEWVSFIVTSDRNVSQGLHLQYAGLDGAWHDAYVESSTPLNEMKTLDTRVVFNKLRLVNTYPAKSGSYTQIISNFAPWGY